MECFSAGENGTLFILFYVLTQAVFMLEISDRVLARLNIKEIEKEKSSSWLLPTAMGLVVGILLSGICLSVFVLLTPDLGPGLAIVLFMHLLGMITLSNACYFLECSTNGAFIY
jgi:O-antigen/teichoic acid export membrane protein